MREIQDIFKTAKKLHETRKTYTTASEHSVPPHESLLQPFFHTHNLCKRGRLQA